MTRTVRATALLSLLWAAQATAQTPAATPAPAAAPAPAPAPPPKLDYDSLAFGRQANTWFLTGEIDSLWAQLTASLRA